MTDPAPPRTVSPTQRFFGGLLMVAGVLMMLACGLCSLVALVAFLSTGNGEDAIGGFFTVLVVGGVPFAFGLAMFLGGRGLRKP